MADVAPLTSLLNNQPPNQDAPALGMSGHTEIDNIQKVITSHTFTPVSTTSFRWGNVPGEIFCQDITEVYERQTQWQKNTFSPPSGHAGTEYVKEHTRLLRAYKDRTPLECVALQALMIMPGLLLQKPHAKAGSKDLSQHLSRWLTLWKAGNIKELPEEANTIQARLPEQDKQRKMTMYKLNQHFAALISKGELHAAISLITKHGKGGVLELTHEVQEALRAKHPEAQL